MTDAEGRPAPQHAAALASHRREEFERMVEENDQRMWYFNRYGVGQNEFPHDTVAILLRYEEKALDPDYVPTGDEATEYREATFKAARLLGDRRPDAIARFRRIQRREESVPLRTALVALGILGLAVVALHSYSTALSRQLQSMETLFGRYIEESAAFARSDVDLVATLSSMCRLTLEYHAETRQLDRVLVFHDGLGLERALLSEATGEAGEDAPSEPAPPAPEADAAAGAAKTPQGDAAKAAAPSPDADRARDADAPPAPSGLRSAGGDKMTADVAPDPRRPGACLVLADAIKSGDLYAAQRELRERRAVGADADAASAAEGANRAKVRTVFESLRGKVFEARFAPDGSREMIALAGVRIQILNMALPPAFAILGALAAVAMRANDRLTSMRLTRVDTFESWTTGILGGVAGATIGIVFNDSESIAQSAGLTQLGLAFVVGYAVDIFFNLLDGVRNGLRGNNRATNGGG
jgi:hypothetical protein